MSQALRSVFQKKILLLVSIFSQAGCYTKHISSFKAPPQQVSVKHFYQHPTNWFNSHAILHVRSFSHQHHLWFIKLINTTVHTQLVFAIGQFLSIELFPQPGQLQLHTSPSFSSKQLWEWDLNSANGCKRARYKYNKQCQNLYFRFIEIALALVLHCCSFRFYIAVADF